MYVYKNRYYTKIKKKKTKEIIVLSHYDIKLLSH